jgi:hypothetical protein
LAKENRMRRCIGFVALSFLACEPENSQTPGPRDSGLTTPDLRSVADITAPDLRLGDTALVRDSGAHDSAVNDAAVPVPPRDASLDVRHCTPELVDVLLFRTDSPEVERSREQVLAAGCYEGRVLLAEVSAACPVGSPAPTRFTVGLRSLTLENLPVDSADAVGETLGLAACADLRTPDDDSSASFVLSIEASRPPRTRLTAAVAFDNGVEFEWSRTYFDVEPPAFP